MWILICSIWLSDHVCFRISLPAVFPFVNFEKFRYCMVKYFLSRCTRLLCWEIRDTRKFVRCCFWQLNFGESFSAIFRDDDVAETFYAFSTNLNVHTPTSSFHLRFRSFCSVFSLTYEGSGVLVFFCAFSVRAAAVADSPGFPLLFTIPNIYFITVRAQEWMAYCNNLVCTVP